MPVPKEFASVGPAGGTVVDVINQEPMVGKGRKYLCVPISIVWIRYSVTGLKQNQPGPVLPFSQYMHMPAVRGDIAQCIADTHAFIDGPLDVWRKRLMAIEYIKRFNHLVVEERRTPDKLSDYVKSGVETLMRTRPSAGPDIWPDTFHQPELETEVWAELRSYAAQFMARPPLPAWSELVRYRIVDGTVAAWTDNRYQLSSHKDFTGPIPSLPDHVIDSCTVLMIYDCRTATNELTSFEGHMMAIRNVGERRTFCDPNVGIVDFPNPITFTAWLQGYIATYQKFQTGGFVKTFSPPC